MKKGLVESILLRILYLKQKDPWIEKQKILYDQLILKMDFFRIPNKAKPFCAKCQGPGVFLIVPLPP